MLKSTLFFSLILFLICKPGKAQTVSANIDNLLIGTWKGTSLCQIKSSPCHDETVVYHISKKGGVDTFYVVGNKIVNGAEEYMGTLHYVYNKKTNQIICAEYGLWTLNIIGTKMEGTLYVRGDLYRKIQLSKQ